jgi:GTP-binding protein
MSSIDRIRNVAIIAHIDHGKTTLIDSIFRTVRVFRENAQVTERVMDSNELERERGITIRSKHCTVEWNGYLINIVDTPGHADFSGEVERVLSMVDSVLLLVDANEGPMPQTRYVLMRALRLGLKPIVIVNKVDRPHADPASALDKTFDLFLELGATDDQCDFPVLYGSGLDGWLVRDLDKDEHQGIQAMFETVIDHVPAPQGDPSAPFLMQVSTLGWRDHIGRTGTGRVLQGRLSKGEALALVKTQWAQAEWLRDESEGNREWSVTKTLQDRATYLWVTRGLESVSVDEVVAGDIVTLAGPKELGIGDTIASPELENPALPPLEIEEPTVSMRFMPNTGPFAGQDGDAVTVRQLKARLDRELRTNVALRVEDLGRGDGSIKVAGRGELHLAILIEEMRREGMELCVSSPEIITHRRDDGTLLEPFEELVVDVPVDYQGTVIEKLARRKGQVLHMETGRSGTVRLEFRIPTRGLIGYRTQFLTDTRGLGIMTARFAGYGPWAGEVAARNRGSMIAMEGGEATSYSLENLQQRGTLFVSPVDPIYPGMIVGENSRPGDLPCNPTKRKALTNHRASGKDHTDGLAVPRRLTLEGALEWIAPDELVEVTPATVRARKATLGAEDRKRDDRRRAG